MTRWPAARRTTIRPRTPCSCTRSPARRRTSTTRSPVSSSRSRPPRPPSPSARRPPSPAIRTSRWASIIEQLALAYDRGYALLSDAQRAALGQLRGAGPLQRLEPDPGLVGRHAAHVERLVHRRSRATTTTTASCARRCCGRWPARTPPGSTSCRRRSSGPLAAYYAQLPGGGSREGTGYGTALRNLFEDYLYWRASTGEDLAALSTHAGDTIDYWVHATVPTRDRFAPIGDQSRSSIPEPVRLPREPRAHRGRPGRNHGPGAARHLVAAEQLGRRRDPQLQPHGRPACPIPPRPWPRPTSPTMPPPPAISSRGRAGTPTPPGWPSWPAPTISRTPTTTRARSRSSRTIGWP